MVRKIHVATDKMSFWKPSSFHIKDGIDQLLFSSNDRYLLVSTAQSGRIWDVIAKKMCGRHECPEGRRICWTQHPTDPGLLVSVHAGEIQIFDWRTFKELSPHGNLRLIHPAMMLQQQAYPSRQCKR